MTIYRSLLRLVLLLPMAGALLICVPPAQALVTHPVPAGTVSLTVVASSRKGLGGRYVWYTALSFPSSLIFGPQGRLYFINADRTILTLSRRGIISVVARGGLQGYAHGPGNRQVPEYNLLNGLAITKKGTLYTLFNVAFSRVTPHGHIVFVPLRSPTGQLLPNPNAPPYPYPARYPSLEYLATGPRGRVYVSDGLSVWRVGQHNTLHLVPAHMRCSIPISAYTQDIVRGAHSHLYATGPNTLSNGMLPPRSEQVTGVYRTSRISPDCVSPRGPWTTIFLGKGFDLQGPIARGPHGHLYVASKRTIYRMRFHSKADGK